MAGACMTPSLPALDADKLRDSERDFLDSFRSLRTRLFRVEYRLRAGARRLCEPLLLPDAGVLLGARNPESAEGAAGVDVLYVAPDSPLSRAGVQAGDTLLELDGRTPRSVSEFNAWLGVSPTPRAARLALRRGSESYRVSVAIPSVCAV